MNILLALVLMQAAQPAVTHVDDAATETTERLGRCTAPTRVVPPFNNSPGAIMQSEAATRIVLSTEDGRAAFPEVDPDRPICSTFAVDQSSRIDDVETKTVDEEAAVGSDLDEADLASEERVE